MATDADTNTETTTGNDTAETGTSTGTDTGTANNTDTGAGAGANAGTLLTGQTGEGAGTDAGNTDSADGKGEAEKGAEAAAYTLTAPEGYPISEGALKGLNDVCKSANLNEEQAKAIMGYMQGNYTSFVAQQQEAMQAQAKTWLGEFKADKEFGGDKFDASVADARKALSVFDQGGVVSKMLDETGYGDNPDVLRIFARVGRAMSEDNIIGKGGGAEQKPLEDRFYNNKP